MCRARGSFSYTISYHIARQADANGPGSTNNSPMARKTVCLLASSATRESAAERDCGRQEHRHVTRARADELVASGEAEWLVGCSVLRSRFGRRGSDLSIRVGETLAVMVYERQPGAREMLQDILRRRR